MSVEFEFEHTHVVRASLVETFALFRDPANLELLTPRWLRFSLAEPPREPAGVGSTFRYRIAPLGFPLHWTAAITTWDPPHGFADVQLRGPYASWRHAHTLEEHPGGTLVRDRILYRLRGGRAGAQLDRLWHRAFLERLFAYRSREMGELLAGSTS